MTVDGKKGERYCCFQTENTSGTSGGGSISLVPYPENLFMTLHRS
jgi:hypothetical protein